MKFKTAWKWFTRKLFTRMSDSIQWICFFLAIISLWNWNPYRFVFIFALFWLFCPSFEWKSSPSSASHTYFPFNSFSSKIMFQWNTPTLEIWWIDLFWMNVPSDYWWWWWLRVFRNLKIEWLAEFSKLYQKKGMKTESFANTNRIKSQSYLQIRRIDK